MAEELSDLDLAYNDEPICPHCGYAHQDASEWADDGVRECDNCGKKFHCLRDICVSYSTSKESP